MPHGQNAKEQSALVRYWDLPAALLLMAALAAAAGRLILTEWTDDLNLVLYATLLGAAAGLALGQSRLPARQTPVFALVYGLFVVFWQLGRTLANDMMWPERLTILTHRLRASIAQLAGQQAVQDPLFFLFLMTSLFWGLSVHGGYAVTRRGRGWRATLPAGCTLLIVQSYDSLVAARVWLLAAHLFLSLLLVARLAYLHHRIRWQRHRFYLPTYLELDLARVILLATVLLVLLAWGIPSLARALPPAAQAWKRATEPWWGTVRERAGNAFASLRSAVNIATYAGYYGETVSLETRWEFPNTAFMTVKVPPSPAGSTRYYWRARVYDQYADGRWTSTLTSTQIITPTRPDLVIPDPGVGSFTFIPAVPMLTLYTPPEPVWVSHRVEASLAYNADGTVDLGTLIATPPLGPNESYRVQSPVSTLTVMQLREAGADYPEWVTSRYLALPPTVTLRTRQLARQIAVDHDTPYDVAAAVTDYLRTRVQYAETIPSPPPDQELLDWLLFDLGRGFCSYYASAEVILLRSLGIPARLAVGFAQGEQEDQGTYQVLQSDTHAWPEVYFPNVGWVEFEPTTAEPPLVRPLGNGTEPYAATASVTPAGEDSTASEVPADELPPEPSPTDRRRARTALAVSGFLAASALVLVFLAWNRRRQREVPPLPILLVAGLRRVGLQPPDALRRWAHRSTLSRLERAYEELNQALTRLDAPAHPADTPAERGAALTSLLPVVTQPIGRLLDEYHAAAYGRRSGDLRAAEEAARGIRTFSRQAHIRRLLTRRKEPETRLP